MRDGDIWFADWNGTGWNTPIELNSQINSGPGIEQSPSVSADGQRLYFVIDYRDGNLWDIWVSTWNPSLNDWGTPVNVGYPINTPDVEFSTHLAPDGRLFFSSSSGFEGCGIYASEWNGSSWSIPQLQWGCGIEVDMEYPSVPADGKWLYFHVLGGQMYAVAWDGSGWGPPAYNLNQQLGGRGGTLSITPSGESLFFAGTTDLGGYGARDIWLAKRVDLRNVRSLSTQFLIVLMFLIISAAIYWMRKVKPIE